jgi:hypothetical protein
MPKKTTGKSDGFDAVLAGFESAMRHCMESGYPQQFEFESSIGRYTVLVAKNRIDEPEEMDASDEFHGCRTGDCPHEKQSECDEFLKKDGSVSNEG